MLSLYTSKNIYNEFGKKWVLEYCFNDLDSDNLNKIGGDNLIPNSLEFNEISLGQSKLINKKYHGCEIRYLNNKDGTKYKNFAQWELPKEGKIAYGDIYTLSFWAKGTEIQAFWHGAQNFVTNKILDVYEGFSPRNAMFSDGCCIFNLTNDWKRYYVTWQLNSEGDLKITKALLLRVSEGNEAQVCGVKFEKGDVISNYLKSNDSLNKYFKDNSYQIIKDSNAFDDKFYIETYQDILEYGNDSIKHYLKFGFDEGCIPNPVFDIDEYLKLHGNNLDGLNPFVHYILDGGGDIVGEINQEINKNMLSPKNFKNMVEIFEKGITIIIPIYNAYEDTKKCIESVLENTTVKFKLILIDDKSTDLRISKLLDEYEKFPNVQTIRNEVNKGFTKNVNIGLNQTNDDVILLNSDTIVTPKWIQKILWAAYSEENIGTLTPISNASDISVPIMNKNNEIPSFLNVNTMSSLVEKASVNGNLIAPTGNGFCLFIKRSTIDDVGLFDEENFGRGYGEETDFTCRASYNGWNNVRNDSILIYHKRSASFSLDKANELKKKHGSILTKKHPMVFSEWKTFVTSEKLKKSIENVNWCLDNFNKNLIKKNVLYITNLVNNKPNVDNVELLSEEFNIFLMTVEKSKLGLWVLINNEFVKFKDIVFNSFFPDFNSLNRYYLALLKSLTIDCLFLQFNNDFKFLKKSPFITPIVLTSNLGIPIYYGNSSEELLNPLTNPKQNKDIILNNIISSDEKGVVYTAIFGDYENLLEPKFINEDLDYICFTDNPNLKSNFWEIKLVDNPNLDNVRKARKVKILPHEYVKEYDYSIWVDAGFQIIGDIKKFINLYSTGKSFMSCIHTNRNCIYDEATECILQKKDNEQVFNAQINKYKKENYPEKYGLIESGVIYRRHNDPKIIKAMDDWCSEVINFSNRDQISLPYVLWKNNLPIDKYRIFYWKNPYFEHFYHQKLDSKSIDFNKFRVILVEKDYEEPLTIQTLNYLKNLNENIVSSVIHLNYDDLHNNNFIKKINSLLVNINEDFVVFLKSGDKINQQFLDYLYNNSVKNLSHVGAVIFDSDYYCNINTNHIPKTQFSIDSPSGVDYINNNVLINKNAMLSINGFDKDSDNLIRDLVVRLNQNKFEILKEDIVGFKLTGLI